MSDNTGRFYIDVNDPKIEDEGWALCERVYRELGLKLLSNPRLEYGTDEWREDTWPDGWEALREFDVAIGRYWGFSKAAWDWARNRAPFFLGNRVRASDGERRLYGLLQDRGLTGHQDEPRELLRALLVAYEGDYDSASWENVGILVDLGWQMPVSMFSVEAMDALLSNRDVYERVLEWHGPSYVAEWHAGSGTGPAIYTLLDGGTPEAFQAEAEFLRTLPQDSLIFSFEGESACTVGEEIESLLGAAKRREKTTWAEEVGGMIRSAMDDGGSQ